VTSDSIWFGSVFDAAAAAQIQADEHNVNHGGAFVTQVKQR
jgi:hypothetical protein